MNICENCKAVTNDPPSGPVGKSIILCSTCKPIIEGFSERWRAAAHAVQSGVAAEQYLGSNDGSPKHLRTGLNLVMRDLSSLARLLMSKGVFTPEEFYKAIAEGMEEEARSYEERLKQALGGRTVINLH